MRNFIVLITTFFIVSCASTSSRKIDCSKWTNPHYCYKTEVEKKRKVVYALWNKKKECKSLSEVDALKCIEETEAEIEIAMKIVDRKSKLLESYLAVQDKERLRQAEYPEVYTKKETSRNTQGDNSDVLIDILSLVDDALNPEPFKIDLPDFDKPIVPEFSIPELYSITVPLSSGSYEVETTPFNEFIIRDLITGKAYKGKANVTQDGVLFENGMVGRIDSNGDFIFSNF